MVNHKNNILTDEDIEYIRKQYYIDCEEVNDKSSNPLKTCSIHGFRHRRLPDLHTFAHLVDKYPLVTLREWGEVFNVTREAVRVLSTRLENEDFKWGERRMELRHGKAPDWEHFENFFSMLVDRDDLSTVVIHQVADMDRIHLDYWVKNNNEIARLYKEAKAVRELKKRNPVKQKCNRCHLEYPIEKFNRDRHTRSGYGRTCKECAYATVKAYNRKRLEEFDMSKVDVEKYCPSCKTIKSRENFHINKANRGGLQGACISCQTKAQMSHPKRRQKFIDAGLDVNSTCRTCGKEKEYIDFYLLRQDQKNEDTCFISPDCRQCFTAEANRFIEENNLEGFAPFRLHTPYKTKLDMPLREYFSVFLYNRHVAPNEEEVARTDDTQEMIKEGKFRLWKR